MGDKINVLLLKLIMVIRQIIGLRGKLTFTTLNNMGDISISRMASRLKISAAAMKSLRECRDDILPLADFFRQLANEEFEKRVKGFDAAAKKRLLAYTWGGNVRELKSVVRMAVLHTEGDTVMADTLEFDENPLATDVSLALNDMEKKQIIHALEQAKATARWRRHCSASGVPRFTTR